MAINILIFCKFLFLIEISICLVNKSNKYKILNTLPCYNPNAGNPYSGNISRLNLTIGGDPTVLSNGKGVLIVNENALSTLVQSHLNIAGISNSIYKVEDEKNIIELVWDMINFYNRKDIDSNTSVVVGCNLGNLQYFWWKIKCLLNNLTLITAVCHNSHCQVGNQTLNSSIGSIFKGFIRYLGLIFDKKDKSILAAELTASVAACESIKCITNKLEPITFTWIDKLKTPQHKPLNILLIGAGAVGCEMVRMLKQMGFLSPGSKITVVDFDIVDKVNLSTQLVYKNEDVGKDKVAAIRDYLTKEPLGTDKSEYIRGRDLEICTFASRFDGENARRIVSDWISNSDNDNRDKLIIAAVDNFKARMLIDRYSMIYQIPLLEVGIDGTKGSSSISIPYLTDPYSSMPGSDIASKASCSVKGIPNDTNDTALFARLVVCSILFKNNNFNQSRSQLRSVITLLFPQSNERWFASQVERIVGLSLDVQNSYLETENRDPNEYLQRSSKSRELMVHLANLRARVFGLDPADPQTILAIIDEIVPSASFTTSAIVALALGNLTNVIRGISEKTASTWFKEYRKGDYKLVCEKGIMTLNHKDKAMIWLKMHKYSKYMPVKIKYLWHFVNLANCQFTKVTAPEIGVWWPNRRCLFGKTRIGLSVWDVFNPSSYDLTLADLAKCYEAMFGVSIDGFIKLADNMDDQVLRVDSTKLNQLSDCLGVRPIAKIGDEVVQLPDTILDICKLNRN